MRLRTKKDASMRSSLTEPTVGTDLEGVLLINKPAGWTSHDVVAKVRKMLGVRKVGHTGTLDPSATGVLVLCLGKATRIAEYLVLADKAYRATLRLGVATDTQDADGAVVMRHQGSFPEEQTIRGELGRMLQSAVDALPETYRTVFVLFHEHGQPYEAIAVALGRPVGTVKTWLHRARLELLDALRRRGMVDRESAGDLRMNPTE